MGIKFVGPDFDTAELGDMLVAQHGPFLLTKTGVLCAKESPEDVEYDEWSGATTWSQHVDESSTFWVGDLIEFGESRFSEKFSQVLEATAYAEQTIRNAGVVARAIPMERRVAGVPFSHHAEVASLPEDKQDQLLAKCQNDGLSREKLRALVAQEKATASGTTVEYQLVVTCATAEKQGELADRLRGEGFSVIAKNKTV